MFKRKRVASKIASLVMALIVLLMPVTAFSQTEHPENDDCYEDVAPYHYKIPDKYPFR